MKYFKKFLLLGIFTLLWVSFCSAWTQTYISNYIIQSTSFKYYVWSLFQPSDQGRNAIPWTYNNISVSCVCSALNEWITPKCEDITLYYSTPNASNTLSELGGTYDSSTNTKTFTYSYSLVPWSSFYIVSSSSNNSLKMTCVFSWSNVFDLDSLMWSSSCDYSWYESQISTLQSQLNTATWSLATCNSNLSSCNTSLNTATWSLATCQSNLATVTWSLVTCQSNLSTATWSLATCQNDLTSCQNSSSSSWTWSCSISDKISDNIIFSWSKNFSNAWYTNMFNYWDYGAWTYCLKFTSTNAQTLSMWFANGWTTVPTNLYSLYNDQYWNWICLYWNKPYLNVKLNSNSNTISYEVYKLTDLYSTSIPCGNGWSSSCDYSWYILESSVNQEYCTSNNLCPSCSSCDYSWYILESNVTQNYCTNRYQNLIPESDITSSYCEVEFWLIDPVNCPSGWSWTGDVQRSALYINNVQYLWSPNIYVNVNDILDYSMTYVSWSAIIDVEGYKADTWYMADILTVQEYHPSSEDFTVAFVSFLTLWLPYVVVILFVVFVRKLIRKIFKS